MLLGVSLFAMMTVKVDAQVTSDGVVKIGVLTDLSGVSSDQAGEGSVTAAKMAVKDFSADSTVLGSKIEVIFADHQNKPDLAAEIARDWYDREHVDMIVDLPNSAVALAVMAVAADRHKLALIASAMSPAIINDQCNAFTVLWTNDFYASATALPTALVREGKKKWFFLTVDYSSGYYLEKTAGAAVIAAGGQVVGAVRHPLDATDFSSFMLKAQASGADVIALATPGLYALNAINTAADFGISGGKQILAPMLLLINDVNTLGLEKTQGMRLIEPFYWDRNDVSRAWAKRFFALRGSMPNSIHAGVYSAVLNYLKAVKGAGTDDGATVMKTLKSTQIDDGLFKGRIREDGRFAHDALLIEVKKPSESKAAWDYYKIAQVLPPDMAAQPLSISTCKLVHT